MTDDPPEFAAPNNAALAGLLFELASQLHVERTRREALEAALVLKGTITAREIEQAAGAESFRAANGAALDRSIRKLLGVLSESKDPRTPLRAEVPRHRGG